MTVQNKGIGTTIVTVSVSILIGVGAAVWLTPVSSQPAIPAQADSQQDHRLMKLEQAVIALAQSLQIKQEQSTTHEVVSVAAPANDATSRQALAQVIRDEVRQAMANQSPEAQRAREEAIANAEILNTPENKAAYQNASSVVTTAVAAKRWTEEDKEAFRAAFIRLTNDQRAELMRVLAPAINSGEIKVEVTGPLF